MRRSPAIPVLLAAALLTAMWATSLAVYDARKTQDALRALAVERSGGTPFHWTFDTQREIDFGHDVDAFEWSGGEISGDLEDPYFYLDLRGRYVDATRFDRARLRLYSGEAGFLRLFHRQLDSDYIHASRRIPVDAGWQTLELDLPALGWQARNLFAPAAERPSGWGGAEGVVSALRVDPVEAGAFAVDWVELASSGAAPPVAAAVEPFGGLGDPLFDRMRTEPGETWLIAQDRLLRTPETSDWVRRRVAAEFPSAILFPRPPKPADLDRPPVSGPASDPGPGWRLPAAAWLLGTLGLLLARRLQPPWRPLLEVASLFGLVQGWVWLSPLLGSGAAAALAAPLLAALWWLRPRPLAPHLFGDWRAWLAVAPLLVLASLLLLLAPPAPAVEGPQGVSVPAALGIYFLWALLQQYVVAVLIQGRLLPVLGPTAIVVSAGLFGFLHFPNFALMCATFALGLVLLEVHRRYRNLPAIAAAQASLSVGFNGLALQYFWLSREIGPAFLAAL